MDEEKLLWRFRVSLGFFIIALILSGITAFPLLHEIKLLSQMLATSQSGDSDPLAPFRHWVDHVRQGIETTDKNYPFLAYGTDWLAFGHIVIAVFFIGPFVKPKESQWILISGMVACIGVIPLALICGQVRGIPFYWRLIDCSFGVIGILPLWYCYKLLHQLKTLPKE